MIWAFDVVDTDANFARGFYQRALEKEMLLRPISSAIGNTVYFMPPYVVTPEEIELMVKVAREGIELATCD